MYNRWVLDGRGHVWMMARECRGVLRGISSRHGGLGVVAMAWAWWIVGISRGFGVGWDGCLANPQPLRVFIGPINASEPTT